jgi:hypothetical protein
MASPITRITHWIVEYLLWDRSPAMQPGFRGGLWATRKLVIALAVAGVLTWREWVEHRPPEIVIVALLHFLFVFFLTGLLVFAGQWLRQRKLSSR